MIYTFKKRPAPKPAEHIYGSQAEFLFERRSLRIKQARVEFPDEHDINRLYWLYCKKHNLKHIPTEYLHEHSAKRQSNKYAPLKSKQIKCMDCGEITVTVDPLCETLPQYKAGYRTSLFCSSCLKTTFSIYQPKEVLKHG